MSPFVKLFDFCQKLFFSQNLDSRCARKSFKGPKVSDDSLDSKQTLSQKIGSLDWRPEPGKIRKKSKNPICDVLTENSKPKTKNFFFQSQLNDVLNPLRV